MRIETCLACGGTGDYFDKETNDWVNPTKPCPICNGTGESTEEECANCTDGVGEVQVLILLEKRKRWMLSPPMCMRCSDSYGPKYTIREILRL